jgi:ABC-type glycerol-3-phosphate transport system substrate-binding protein
VRRRLTRLGILAAISALAVTAAGCGGGGGSKSSGGGSGGGNVSGTVAVMGVWTGQEQAAFKAVLKGFTDANPDVTVNYTSAGDQLPTQLSTAVEGGNPPDVAFLPQPGLMNDFVKKGALKPLDYAKSDVKSNLGDSAVSLGSVDGKLYGFIFKAANKSTVWYNVKAFDDAGVKPPETGDDLLKDADTLKASGIPAYSVGGADGWTLTDLFENIYLRQAGADTYDKLAKHEIPWTDPSVKKALTTMAAVLGDKSNIAGNALQIDFPTSVSNVFSANPKAAMVMEGDFVPGSVKTTLPPTTGYDVFPFPSIDGSPPSVVGGGDTAVAFDDSAATKALIRYLTTADAATIWAKRGGFATLNKNVDPSVYPDDITRTTAGAIGKSEVFRFDLSDLQPAAFGGTVGQGLFKLFQDFLANPKNVDGIASQMEAAATKAYG